MTVSQRGAAFTATCAGIAVFACMDAVMKGQSIAIGAFSAMFWRSLFGVLLTVPLFLADGGGRPSAHAMRLHGLRGTVAALSIVLFFWGLARVPMAQAIALTFIAPLIALFLAAVTLKERIPRGAILASGIAFAGVVTIVSGQARAALSSAALAGQAAILAAAVLYAAQLVLLRKQAQAARPSEVACFTNLVFLGVYALAAPWLLVLPAGAQWGWLGLAALLATTSILALAWAYARAEASYLAPVEYTAFVWAALLGWLVFGERVQAATLAGAGLIVIGCAIAARSRPPPGPSMEAA